jgi:hypothetical protein
VRDDEDGVTGREEVGDGRLERAGARRGEDEDVVLRPEHLLQALDRLVEDVLEVRRAVMDHRLRHGGEDLRRNRRRAWSEEIALLRHPLRG